MYKIWAELQQNLQNDVHTVKTQINLHIQDVCLKKFWVLEQPVKTDWAEVQADLSLCWRHVGFCRFYCTPAHVVLILCSEYL